MSKTYTYTITFSPCIDDEVPFSYGEDGLVSWVDEVFLEGYKKPDGEPFPSLDECLDILQTSGYVVSKGY